MVSNSDNKVDLHVRVSQDVGRFARSEVDAGHYPSLDEVIEAGLRALQDDDGFPKVGTPEHAALKAQLERASKQADEGKFKTWDDLMVRIEEEKAKRA